ncbi:MAG: hypothetical protein GXP25_13660 [Planctomycetes bacterium]|nr:hypothetical protein [Planctomycetota bacterium]
MKLVISESDYATKMNVLHVTRFEPRRAQLYILLMKHQYLAYRFLIKEKPIPIAVGEAR